MNLNDSEKINFLSQNLCYNIKSHLEFIDMQPGNVLITFANTTKLQEDFCYKPITSSNEGLLKFAEWYYEFYILNKGNK